LLKKFFILIYFKFGIGVITNLIVFPPTLLLVQIFRRTKRRNTRISKIKSLLKLNNLGDNNLQNKVSVKKGFKQTISDFKLPWWFKIIAYMLSFVFAGVCLFFIIVQGITFGNEKCESWLTSLIISFLTSIFLTQPIQVILLLLKLQFFKINIEFL
jgi:polycystin 1L2